MVYKLQTSPILDPACFLMEASYPPWCPGLFFHDSASPLIQVAHEGRDCPSTPQPLLQFLSLLAKSLIRIRSQNVGS